MKNILKYGFMALMALLIAGCQNVELDELLENPNSVSPDRAELNFVMNAARKIAPKGVE